jgi:hypothetical protein
MFSKTMVVIIGTNFEYFFHQKQIRMETIRIIKRRKSSSFIWGILLALIVLGAIVWFVVDQNVLDREGFSLNRDNIESNEYRSGEYRSDEYRTDEYRNFNAPRGNLDRNRSFDNTRENMESDQVQAYVSFVNRQVIPAASIDNQITEQAHSHLKRALDEVAEKPIVDHREGIDNDRFADAQRDNQEKPSSQESLIETGNELVDIQKNDYPSLSRMGEAVKESLSKLKNSENQKSEDLKNFFILSSSLIQEMDSERTNGQITANRRTYEDNK